jgi:hypothetical protein
VLNFTILSFCTPVFAFSGGSQEYIILSFESESLRARHSLFKSHRHSRWFYQFIINTVLSLFNKINIQIPNLCKGYDEYNSFQGLIDRLHILHRNFLKKIEGDINSKNLYADKIIEDIFSKTLILSRADDIIQKAFWRFNVGNPPGKDKSYGDTINWETLLATVPVNEDVFLLVLTKIINLSWMKINLISIYTMNGRMKKIQICSFTKV